MANPIFAYLCHADFTFFWGTHVQRHGLYFPKFWDKMSIQYVEHLNNLEKNNSFVNSCYATFFMCFQRGNDYNKCEDSNIFYSENPTNKNLYPRHKCPSFPDAISLEISKCSHVKVKTKIFFNLARLTFQNNEYCRNNTEN